MAFNLTSDRAHMELRKQELLRQAKLQTLVREAQANQPKLGERLLALWADLTGKPVYRWEARPQTRPRVTRINDVYLDDDTANLRESA